MKLKNSIWQVILISALFCAGCSNAGNVNMGKDSVDTGNKNSSAPAFKPFLSGDNYFIQLHVAKICELILKSVIWT